MSDFELPIGPIPTKVRIVELYLTSAMEPELDEHGGQVENGEDVQTERLLVRAKVEDQYGVERWVHSGNYQKAIDVGVLTAQQATQLRDLIILMRETIEGKVLPPQV